MREYINLVESKSEESVMKKTIIDIIKNTDDKTLLHKVLKTLESGNIDERISDAIKDDADAKQFVKQITDIIVNTAAPMEEKEKFLKQYPKGFIDTTKLLDGKAHSFSDLVGSGFPAEVFTQLTTALSSYGIGPGEVALAVMSPKIKWTGRVAGGGDIIVGDKNVEVKAGIRDGGRWINPRKSEMNVPAIKKAIEEATNIPVPARLNIESWVNTFRPAVPPKKLSSVCETIANGLFAKVNTNKFKKALETGTAAEIADELLRTGFNNYKKVSDFEGMLLMGIGDQMCQYFTSYDDMKGKIRVGPTYLYGPEGEVMPKVLLNIKGEGGGPEVAPSAKEPEQGMRQKRGQSEKEFAKAAGDIALGRRPAAKATVPAPIGRKLRPK